MAVIKKVQSKEMYMGKLKHGEDLLEELTKICYENDMRLGRIEAIGAVQKARIGFYSQEKREYQYLTLDRPLEITKLIGNISLKDGKPMVHAHITMADEAGRAYGGHLASGTIIFACEVLVESFDGPIFERDYDHETGLPLWVINT